ncbi:hypothetical protein [Cytobacillus oceanisediminis]|uniref:Uncharacterized protein n=1 Tax=Cytobacillus oceanisediminis 2691 TaxID=1196031 RepID=A0A160M9Z7_9BACI|nr:hypothetical protein [Cytobacillus oceanisediminis]AND39532.1 hypothetical protein A361_10435 [Cytobacillus oceanisediminis 2691]
MKQSLNQVNVYSVTTDVFFSREEMKLKVLKDRLHDLKRLSKEKSSIQVEIASLKDDSIIENNEHKKNIMINQIASKERQLEYLAYLEEEVFKGEKPTKAGLKRDLKEMIKQHEDVRILNPLRLNISQVISLFESPLTRKLEMEKNKLSEKIIVVEVFNYEIFDSILDKGFKFRNKEFVYWSSSSGQIRDKKAFFIEKEAWSNIENSITAGLTDVDINNNGGMSVNKYLAYKALASSASYKWKNFNIDKCIVVDDVAVSLEGRTVDFISRETFEIERTNEKSIELEITDGAGMMLPQVSEKLFGIGVHKNMQFRLPWMKGCLSAVPFLDYKENPVVTDIYGKEWNLKDSGIEIVFFKSQFKMWKHFINKDNPKESWKKYQVNFKKYNCEASFMNVEEDNIPNAKTNYQYLQSLVNISDSDLMEIADLTNEELQNLGSDADTMLRVLGASDDNDNKNEFQQALNLYPALLNDKNTKKSLKDKKEKILEEAMAGKVNLEGKYTYALPDWYAVMENIFDGIDNPKGLLGKAEVSCSLYGESKVDLLRSPALSFEHVIRQNRRSEKMTKWYITKGVHVSADDAAISKILMCDYDGDKLLISPSKTLIRVAEEHIKLLDVVPLEYEMGVSEPKLINSANIFESLKAAFKANIGIISNNLTKLYNKENFDVKKDYELVKKLTSYNNHVIDMAKTLDEVKLPSEVKEEWNYYCKEKLPYFFIQAKGKPESKVNKKNDKVVNRLQDFIINRRITFKSVVEQFDYKYLMWTPNIKENAFVIDEETDSKIIEKYTALDTNKRYYINDEAETKDGKKPYIYTQIREELLSIHPEAQEVSDVLVRFLFGKKDSEYKKTLFESFGVEVVDAIRKNVHSEINCRACGELIPTPEQRQIRCDSCQKAYRKRLDAERKRKTRKILKEMSA